MGETLLLKKQTHDLHCLKKKCKQLFWEEKELQNYRVYDSKDALSADFVEIILDTSSIEVFIEDGQKTMSMRIFPNVPLTICELLVDE